MKEKKPTVALIGAGAAGTALALALHRCGYPIRAVASRTLGSAERAAALLDHPTVTADSAAAARQAELVIIATPDAAITPVCDAIAEQQGFQTGQTVIHLSGALPSSALASAQQAGARILAFHPIQTLSDPLKGSELLHGACYCLEGDAVAIALARGVVSELHGTALVIAEGDKPLYHAALCMASNYLVVLQSLAVDMLEQAGIGRQPALTALLPLIQGSVENLRHSGLPQALTGPISRGDRNTIAKHLEALRAMPDDCRAVYRIMGRAAIGVALAKGGIGEAGAEALTTLLGETPEEPEGD